jgi:hypothetical protein
MPDWKTTIGLVCILVGLGILFTPSRAPHVPAEAPVGTWSYTTAIWRFTLTPPAIATQILPSHAVRVRYAIPDVFDVPEWEVITTVGYDRDRLKSDATYRLRYAITVAARRDLTTWAQSHDFKIASVMDPDVVNLR